MRCIFDIFDYISICSVRIVKTPEQASIRYKADLFHDSANTAFAKHSEWKDLAGNSRELCRSLWLSSGRCV